MRVDKALLLLALSGCAFGQVVPGVPESAPEVDSWQLVLQACKVPDAGLVALASELRLDDGAVCQRALDLGRRLECVALQLPALAPARNQFTDSGLLEFHACVHPLAAGLLAGRLGHAQGLALEVRQCVLQLDRAVAVPTAAQPWWRLGPGPSAPGLALASTAAARLPPPASPSWPPCAAVAALKAAAAAPALVAASAARPVIDSPVPARVPEVPQRRPFINTQPPGVAHDT